MSALGSRIDMSSPRRNVVLSQPSCSTARIGSAAHSGNCSLRREPATSVEMLGLSDAQRGARSRIAWRWSRPKGRIANAGVVTPLAT